MNHLKAPTLFRYAPLEKMIEIVRPILAEHGLGFTQGAAGDMLETTIFHVSGEWITHSMPLHDPGTSQAYGAQFTYKRRYSLKAALGLETDDDNSEMGEDQPKKKGKILSGPIPANVDAMNNVPKERREYVTRVAGTVVDYFNANQQNEAYKALMEVTDAEEKLGVWSFLDSKMRRYVQNRQAEERKNNG